MINKEKILIASSSDNIISYVCKRLEETGVQKKVYRARNEDELRTHLRIQCPGLLFIEDSFWHSATPQELMLLGKRNRRRMWIYVFGVGDSSTKYIKRIIQIGVDGFLNIRNGPVLFRKDLKKALSGESVIPPDIKYDEMDYSLVTGEKLTKHELRVINLIMEGMNNEEIGKTLNIKLQTVKNERSRIYAKTNASNTVGLIKYLFRSETINYKDFVAS